MDRIAGKIAIVTGAGAGIGQGISLRFASEGARVLAVDISESNLRETSSKAKGSAGRFVTHVNDTTATDAPKQIIEACRSAFGLPHILVNNAGKGSHFSVHETSDVELDGDLNLNLRGTFRMSREFLNAVMNQGGACIVNITSSFGLVGFTHSASYAAAKAGIVGLTRQMAADYGRYKIRVNAVAPGLTETARIKGMIAADENFRTSRVQAMPLGRLATPEDVASAVLFLSSDEAGFITGQTLAVDGGFTTTQYRVTGTGR